MRRRETRIFTGNVSEWMPPRRFTYVRTGLEYVPPGDESTLLRRLLREFIVPGGRVIVGPIDEGAIDAGRRAFQSAGAAETVVASPPDRNGKTRYVVWSQAN